MFEELKPHLAELRKRLTISFVSVIIGFFVCFSFWNPILAWMSEPLKEVLPEGSNIIFTQIQEPFFTAMKVAFFTGLILTLPIIFWQFWLFVAPGLYENEKKYVIPFVLSATLMFLCGASFCYYVVVPLGFKFLVNFGGQLFTALPSIGEYVGFFTKILVAFGLAFELPVITFFFAKLGLVDDQMLKNYSRHAIVIIFIFAAVMTPPDVISQLLMAFPLLGLYGISIMIAKKVNPYKSDNEEDETQSNSTQNNANE
ncbi:twin arginine translocation system, TatC protein [Campylobacter pinnipediorum subsp. caledonicus]|uniref:Sec-independent protein translocase protein TatC n=1 Tax=Campylobacter pinnipediorum subsp. caledonicus TaxID=1874362 RepID=A0A1S6U955_9BACT|nr:twin-arginine translocase subunit TatC [Campylobacter pinnipediorum]AQW86324.1 twin arginine translocation system, TatC protein [Campylobacter pinnipediorum subsp. caledonicus]AQW87977.1 twin arginine translocation system, TatC protein [Campylobacter pinnipediorum subsp. caledonicus]OPA71423.1 twin arginine-targeting protein translocase TatC [Campylobacter pinnipediorum subsp. caledonicus]